MKLYYDGWHYLLRGAVPLLARMKVRGVEHIPRTGPVLLVGNHISLCDPPVLLAYVKRHVHFIVKAELFSRFPLSIIMPPGEPIKVNRDKLDRTALRQAEGYLKAGGVVAIYAEGTRNREGAAQQARAGVVFLAQRTDAQIVPAAISGTERVFRPRFPWYRRTAVQLTFGRPFRLDELAQDPKADRAGLAQAVMGRVAELLPPKYRGVYGANAEPADTDVPLAADVREPAMGSQTRKT